ncbi:hypothetical protein FHS67_006283 [Aminobacter aminovorans]|uniref:Uncharacterized protein n=1 Tax=Aminobacter aminovorans TaxID=83263 RepID=A0ABR6HH92_AMIAI|nr:hypothetical protein [Aminobacter aminovorans]
MEDKRQHHTEDYARLDAQKRVPRIVAAIAENQTQRMIEKSTSDRTATMIVAASVACGRFASYGVKNNIASAMPTAVKTPAAARYRAGVEIDDRASEPAGDRMAEQLASTAWYSIVSVARSLMPDSRIVMSIGPPLH